MDQKADDKKHPQKTAFGTEPEVVSWGISSILASTFLLFLMILFLIIAVGRFSFYLGFLVKSIIYGIFTILFFIKAYHGLAFHSVQIFPDLHPPRSDERSFVGGRVETHISGKAGRIAGFVFLLLGLISCGFLVRQISPLIRAVAGFITRL